MERGRTPVSPKDALVERLHRMPRSHTHPPPWPRRVAFLHPLPCTLRCPLHRARPRQWATHTSHTHMEQSDGTAVPVTGDVATSPCPSPVPPPAPPMPLMSPASFANEVQIEEECLLRLLVAHYHGHLHAADCVPHGCGYLTVRGRGDAHQSRGGACVCVCACTLRDQSRVLEGMSAGEGGLRRAESSSQAVAGGVL